MGHNKMNSYFVFIFSLDYVGFGPRMTTRSSHVSLSARSRLEGRRSPQTVERSARDIQVKEEGSRIKLAGPRAFCQ